MIGIIWGARIDWGEILPGVGTTESGQVTLGSVVGPFAQPRDAAQWVEEEESVQPNLRKGDYWEKVKGVA